MALPPRHWFQFSLSTWFVLVAILAWAMIAGPEFTADFFAEPPWPTRTANRATFHANYDSSTTASYHVFFQIKDTNKILYPALALAAFVAWKTAWAIGRRVVGRKAEQP